jgi:hypothetical protein
MHARDTFYDAINLFKFSPTGLGRRSVGGDSAYEARYRQLASDVVDKLWDVWGRDKIVFKNLPYRRYITWGQSSERPPGRSQIEVSNHLDPSYGLATDSCYIDPQPLSKLAAVSLTLCHEAVHLVVDAQYPEEETRCRTLALLYYEDLAIGTPVTVVSRVINQTIAPRLPASGAGDHALKNLVANYESERVYYSRSQLIDYVLNNTPAYRPSLTADWIARSITWWGGITNRWPMTRGFYLDVVVHRGSRADAELVLRLLESFATRQEWQDAKVALRSLQEFRRRLTSSYAQNDPGFARRLRVVGQRIGEGFGLI